MKKTLITAAVVALFCGGCSNSSGPSNTYPLLLTTVSDSVGVNSGIFNFRVTKNGAPLADAKLRRTNFPSNQTYDLGIKSDSNGYFPRVSVVLVDTLTGVAYQAVHDTLSSNYVRWSP
ncbi:MAG: hypothetical protein ACHQNE_06700 [Candidatus Kapaibacterium sp.]